MIRNNIMLALLVILALLTAPGSLNAQQPPPRPEKYNVPFSAAQNFQPHHASFPHPRLSNWAGAV